MMKRYFLVAFLLLKLAFLHAQNEKNESPKPLSRKWELGIQGNILLSNRIYVERYLKKNWSVKVSYSFSHFTNALQTEMRYYPKIEILKSKYRPYFSAGANLGYIRDSFDNKVFLLFYSTHALFAVRRETVKHWHFEVGLGAEVYHFPNPKGYYDHNGQRRPYNWRRFYLIPAVTLRIGIHWNEN